MGTTPHKQTHTITMMLKMNLFFVVAAWVALLATVSVSATDQQGLRGGQHRALEVHNEQPDAAEYFEGSEEEEEFLSLEEREEMGLDAEDRDLAYGYGNGSGRFHSGGVRGGYGGRGDYIRGNGSSGGVSGSAMYGIRGNGGYGGYGSGGNNSGGGRGYGSGYGGYLRGNGYGN